jgi:AcrR family transcriptional regulator
MTDTAVPLTDRGRRTREALVVAAARVFAERGYAGTRMQDVAAAAGVSHGTVYTWFAKKDDLLRAVTHVIVGEVFDASRDRTDEPADPYERLSSANRRFLASYRRHARMLAVVEEAASTDPRWAGLLDDLRQTYVGRAERTLRRLRDEGRVADDVVPELAAPALTGMVETFARRAPADRGDPDGDADQLTRLWARAVGLAVPDVAVPVPPTPGERRP